MSSSTQNIGRDELAAMLGASYASDLIAAAGTSASDLAKQSGGVARGGAVLGRKHYVKGGGIDEEDVSKMDRAQAAALVARKFAGGGSALTGAVGSGAFAAGALTTVRHRASGKRKRLLQHHLLVEDLIDTQDGMTLDNSGANENDVMKSYIKEDRGLEKDKEEDDEEEERFAIRPPADGVRKKSEAKVLVRRGGDEETNRRHRSSSSSESSVESVSSSSSRSVSSSVSSSSRQHSRSTGHDRRMRRRRGGRGRGKNNDDRRTRSNSSSSSSSSSEDQADIRRRKAREKRAKEEGDGSTAVPSIHHDTNGKQLDDAMEVAQTITTCERSKGDTMSVDIESKINEATNDRSSTNSNNGHKRSPRSRRRSNSSGDESSCDSSFSSTSEESSSSSSSYSSSDDEANHNATLPMPASKPIFVPKSKRGTVAELEVQHQKHEEFEKRRAQEAEKRAIQSRALVAAAAAMSSAGKANSISEGDEFDTGEVGGEFIPVPDDTDPTEEDSPELVAVERNAWEVRELIRILRDVDDALERERERREVERRRALTDEERLEEDRLSGRYRAPGEARRRPLREDAHINGGMGSKGGGKQKQDESSNRYLQRFHHRGAFYMDEDTLNQAGEDDVRHRAAEYSRAATGEDKIDKSALPRVMQVKKFGFAGYSTKYKGLAKEDTTDKKMDFLPIRGPAGRKSRP